MTELEAFLHLWAVLWESQRVPFRSRLWGEGWPCPGGNKVSLGAGLSPVGSEGPVPAEVSALGMQSHNQASVALPWGAYPPGWRAGALSRSEGLLPPSWLLCEGADTRRLGGEEKPGRRAGGCEEEQQTVWES